MAGKVAVCANCQGETTLPAVEVLGPAVETSAPNFIANGYVEMRLSSGVLLEVGAIMLYNERVVAAWNASRSKAIQLIGGVSTGLGSIGSLDWVIETSVAIAVIDGLLSAGARSEGQVELEKAVKLERTLRNHGRFCAVGMIHNATMPVPAMWRVPQAGDDGNRAAYIDIGDDFKTVKLRDESFCSVRWSAVEHYIFVG